ncbi:MAG: arabinan endo-1,5-alpha-L-arabinosidase [Armatimonadota bacterium]
MIHHRRPSFRIAVAMAVGVGLLFGAAGLTRAQRAPEPAAGAIRHVHDPCLIKQGDAYYLFSTGHGIPIRKSKDLVRWELVGRVFKEDLPTWAREEIPGSVFPWAPDIAYLNGRYHLYYSVSSFGKNRSLIALATNKTLDPQSPDYAWKDEGKVFESHPGDDHNAIDSNVLLTKQSDRERLAFTFGSFWSGLKLIEMMPTTGKLPDSGAPVIRIASRPRPGAVEAPFLIERDGYHYLFVSFDFCCRGVRSTYNIRVGRSKKLEGPYLDREGKSLLEEGGTPVLATKGREIGPGHCAVLREPGRDLLVYHFYDGMANGIPTLQIRPLSWDADGWPTPGEPLVPLPDPGVKPDDAPARPDDGCAGCGSED